jgi:hypothetical protein
MQEQMPQDQGGEDQIIDQIGALMQKLSPEKQMAIIQKLSEMMGGDEAPQPVENVSPEGGPNGKPVGY